MGVGLMVRVFRFEMPAQNLAKALSIALAQKGVRDEDIINIQVLPLRPRTTANGIVIPMFEVIVFARNSQLTRDELLRSKYRA